MLTSDYFSPYLPLASKRSRECPDFAPPTYHLDHHVLSGRHHLHRWSVSLLVHLHLRGFLGLLLYV
jgi:hypothetical protein